MVLRHVGKSSINNRQSTDWSTDVKLELDGQDKHLSVLPCHVQCCFTGRERCWCWHLAAVPSVIGQQHMQLRISDALGKLSMVVNFSCAGTPSTWFRTRRVQVWKKFKDKILSHHPQYQKCRIDEWGKRR